MKCVQYHRWPLFNSVCRVGFHGINSGVTTIGAGRAVAPPLFDGSKLKIIN